MKYLLGIDVGGTFTDIACISSEGTTYCYKLLSTPNDYTRAIINGVEAILSNNNIDVSDIVRVAHGCTVATNAILEHKGARTGLITTKGFRDVLEIRRYRMPVLYDLRWQKPLPLASREYRLEVEERISASSEILKPLDVESVKAAAKALVDKGVESLAICFLNSYINPVHEQQAKQIINEMYPDLFVTTSSDLIPVIKEYERTSEAVVNSYVRPAMVNYLKTLTKKMRDIGISARLDIMQSGGGMMSVDAAMEKPVYAIESGPAAGVVGAAFYAKQLGLPNVIALDMGGTTTKVSVIEDYKLSQAASYEVGSGISISGKLIGGGGYTIRVPSIDIAEIGAGGGSIIWIKGGILHVGPASAGASPGPACYDKGGTEPTLCDANLVLGYLNPKYLTGGTTKISAAKSQKVIGEKVAKPLGMNLEEAAYGAYAIANSVMITAIQAVTTERGRDPRDFALVLYGGAAALHGAQIANELGIKKVLILPNAGTASAFGLLFSDTEYTNIKSVFKRLDTGVIDQLNAMCDDLEEKTILQFGIDPKNRGKLEVKSQAKLEVTPE